MLNKQWNRSTYVTDCTSSSIGESIGESGASGCRLVIKYKKHTEYIAF